MKSKLALISLILGVSSFVNLLGIEKAVLAVIIGTWALKESDRTAGSKRLSRIGIVFGILYLVVITTAVIVFFPKMTHLLERLK